MIRDVSIFCPSRIQWSKRHRNPGIRIRNTAWHYPFNAVRNVLTQCTARATNTPARPSKVVSSGPQLAQVRIYITQKTRIDPMMFFPVLWIRIQEQGNWQNLQTNLYSSLRKRLPTFYDLLLTVRYIKYIFHLKIQLLWTEKSDQDPGPHWFGFMDPDPH